MNRKHEICLSKEQIGPVYSNARLNVCLSVPGSGKTTVLTERAKRLRRQTGEPVLAITFSRKAATEIEKRIGGDQGVKVTTIHGLCLGVVREHWETLGRLAGRGAWPSGPTVVDRKEEMRLIEELYPERDPRRTHDSFAELRRYGCDPQTMLGLMKAGGFFGKLRIDEARLWAEYEQARLARGMLTYDDMATVADMLLPLPEVSTALASKWAHLLVDEAQDTSHVQWRVIRAIVASAKTTLAVGDLNQSVYGWRDADGSVLRRLGELEGSVVFHLRKSYRSRSLIARLANLVCPDGSSQIETENGEGTVRVHSFASRFEEVSAVLSDVDERTAILARTNAYLEPFEQELIRRGIPYGGAAFYRAPHIVALASFVRRVSGDAIVLATKAFLKNEDYTLVEKEDFRLALATMREKGVDGFLDLVQGSVPGRGGVTLMTGHAAKGLEWDRVYVVGASRGHMPHPKSHDPQEESRLFYVMVTRPREELHLCYVEEPSPLIPPDYLK